MSAENFVLNPCGHPNERAIRRFSLWPHIRKFIWEDNRHFPNLAARFSLKFATATFARRGSVGLLLPTTLPIALQPRERPPVRNTLLLSSIGPPSKHPDPPHRV
jgi:hypothetical protein